MRDRNSSAPIGMSTKQMEQANLARLRRDFRELTPEQRVRQVAELSQQLSRRDTRDGD